MPPKRFKCKQLDTSQKSIVDEDRISDLPRNVIDCILGNMPIREAVRTSVLSKKWRFYYLTIPQLVFDILFSTELYDFTINRYAFSDIEFKHLFDEIITKFLMLHPGGIEKFTVWIPDFSGMRVLDVNKWILYLSRKNIKELTLDQNRKDNERHKLPPYFFSCLDLTFLELLNYVLSPPLEFKGFQNLDQILLRGVDFANNCFESFISSCPVLRRLLLSGCSGVSHFNISSSKLKMMDIEADNKFESVSLENAPNLTEVFFTVESGVVIGLGGTAISDLGKFVDSLPKVVILGLNGKFLQLLAAGTLVPRVLSPSPDSLQFLEVKDVNFMVFDEISAVVCLIRSARNLQELYIEASTVEINEEHVWGYLKLLDCKKFSLNKLHLVCLTKISGFDTEFEFIRFLLFSVPSLMKMIIVEHPNLNADKALDLARKLLLLQPPSAVSIDFSRESET